MDRDSLSSVFWSPDFWLPPGIDWAEFHSPQAVNVNGSGGLVEPYQFPRPSDLAYSIPLAFCLLQIRVIVIRLLLSPLGRWAGLPPPHVPHSKLANFCEACWHLFNGGANVAYGFFVLWDKPWFTDPSQCWEDYPFHAVNKEMWWFFMLELAFYGCQLIMLLYDVKRDEGRLVEMFSHHFITIGLIVFSWFAHFTRICSLAIIIHESSDHLLELWRILRFLGRPISADLVFGVYTIVWTVARCLFFPRLIFSGMTEATAVFESFPAFYLLLLLCCLLQVLNIYWQIQTMRFFLKIIKKYNLVNKEHEE